MTPMTINHRDPGLQISVGEALARIHKDLAKVAREQGYSGVAAKYMGKAMGNKTAATYCNYENDKTEMGVDALRCLSLNLYVNPCYIMRLSTQRYLAGETPESVFQRLCDIAPELKGDDSVDIEDVE